LKKAKKTFTTRKKPEGDTFVRGGYQNQEWRGGKNKKKTTSRKKLTVLTLLNDRKDVMSTLCTIGEGKVQLGLKPRH